MSYPPCSGRVLSLFIEGFSGRALNIRPAPRTIARPTLRQIYPRNFGTRFPLRSQESQASPEADSSHGATNDTAESSSKQSGNKLDADEARITELNNTALDAVTTVAQAEESSSTRKERKMKRSQHIDFEPSPLDRHPSSAESKEPKHKSKKPELNHESALSRTKYNKDEKNKRDEREHWQVQKDALKGKFGETGWAPIKRLSPDALEGIRTLYASDPVKYSTPVLANEFQVSPEAIRRILKSKWRPNEKEQEERMERWERRGERIWTKLVETGVRPPKKWRDMGVGRVEGGRGVKPAWKKGGRRQSKEDDIPFDFGKDDGTSFRKREVIATNPATAYAEPNDWSDRIL